MNSSVVLTPGAARDLRRLPEDIRPRMVAAALQGLADGPRPPGCVKLSGSDAQTSPGHVPLTYAISFVVIYKR